MTTKAILGHGTTVSIGDASGGTSTVFTELTADIVNIGGISFSRDAIDATHLGSNGFKEFIAGLRDGGDFSLGFHYVPSASDEMYGHFNSDALDLRITAPDGVTTITVQVIPTGWSTGDFNNEKLEGTATFKLSGVPVFAA